MSLLSCRDGIIEINKKLISFSYCRFHVKRKRYRLFVCLARRLAKPLVGLERQVFQFQQSVVRFGLVCFFKTLLNLYLLDCLPEITLTSWPASGFTCVCLSAVAKGKITYFPYDVLVQHCSL